MHFKNGHLVLNLISLNLRTFSVHKVFFYLDIEKIFEDDFFFMQVIRENSYKL